MIRNLNKEQLEHLYTEEYLSTRSIGKLFGCSGTTIRSYLIQYGVPMRGYGGGRGSKDGTYLHEGYVVKKVFPSDPLYSMGNKRCPNSSYVYVFEHRLVVAKHLGRCLHPWEVVHHKNGIRNDNRLENLKLVSSPEKHTALTNTQQRIKWLEQRVTQLEAESALLKAQQLVKIEE